MSSGQCEFPEGVEESPPRYCVGIDLGTTNSAVSFVDSERRRWRVETFAVRQLVAVGTAEARETAPSFHYQATPAELAPGESAGFCGDHCVGVYARDQGALAPGRSVASAKSWLSHSAVDRHADLLPLAPAEGVKRISPVEASARYLRHMRSAWDAAHPAAPLAQQDVAVTLPASFDEIARELTVQAARRAGLPRILLLEEPQAAFYAWIDRHQETWQSLVRPGQKILVCDVGGGTSDFTLIRVKAADGGMQFHRIAVGEHLILGGDNLDLALAHYLEPKLTGGGERELSPRQWDTLVRLCRETKERLLADDAPEKTTLTLPGEGTKILAGSKRVEITREAAERVLADGFFPLCELTDRPTPRQVGVRELGLPYAADPAVTKYLAAFLVAHRHTGMTEAEIAAAPHDPARPDVVLFNGAVFESSLLRRRITEALADWFEGRQPQVLQNERLDLAVSRGAAYYGMVCRGEGVKVVANLARSYYVGVQTNLPFSSGRGAGGERERAATSTLSALCLAPGDAEAGQRLQLDLPLAATIGEPVEFPLFVSSVRLADRPGELVEIDEEAIRPLAPIRTVLTAKSRNERGAIGVRLEVELTEIGALDMWLREATSDRRWRLQFDVRAATQTDHVADTGAGEAAGMVEETTWQECEQILAAAFGPVATREGRDGISPADAVKRLTEAIGENRWQWPPSLLRRIWQALIEHQDGRRKSEKHEARWLNLLGFSLRPGFGVAMDDWRVGETWKLTYGKLAHATPQCRAESRVLWRRIAGGLAEGQQKTVADPLLASLRGLKKQSQTGRGRGTDFTAGSHEAAEIWRLLGSLERLPVATRHEIGDLAAAFLGRRKMQDLRAALLWAIGRTGARQPVYGPLSHVAAVEKAEQWLGRILTDAADLPAGETAAANLAVMQLARKSGDRYRDVSPAMRDSALAFLQTRAAPTHYLKLVTEGGVLDEEELGQVIGERLPVGLALK